MSTLNVVCLISGGKDSFFSALHCLKNGHQVVALANLHPPSDGVEDMDSFMYQTVGHTVIPMYQTALGLPLYRQAIIGTAVNQQKCYGPADDDDETEALIPLLRQVQAHHPEVNAVSTGAILSDYQRTRVESVALRLGLVPLSYLWQWPNLRPHAPDALLHDMAAVGQDSRIIKVASGGLDERMLWQNVAHPGTVARLNKAAQRFGVQGDGAVLGEGGEYETLALSGPAPLWNSTIVVDDNHRRILAGEAGSAAIQISSGRVIPGTSGNISSLRTPDLFEPHFKQILDNVQQTDGLPEDSDPDPVPPAGMAKGKFGAEHILHPSIVGAGTAAADQMRSIMEQACLSLQRYGHGLEDVAYTSIILRNMDDFASINTIYGSYFTRPNPPARATIASASTLPDGRHVMVSLTSIKCEGPHSRVGLHVQSRSYWAPANIGPYSQAVRVSNASEIAITYIAGQIPLMPASMELPIPIDDMSDQNAFFQQAVLALQHLDRIGRVMRLGHWACVAAFVATSASENVSSTSRDVQRVWGSYQDSARLQHTAVPEEASEDDSFDIWDAAHGNQRQHLFRRQRDAYDATGIDATSTPLYVIQVDALPKGSKVEWVAFGATSQADGADEIPHFRHLLDIFQSQIIV